MHTLDCSESEVHSRYESNAAQHVVTDWSPCCSINVQETLRCVANSLTNATYGVNTEEPQQKPL